MENFDQNEFENWCDLWNAAKDSDEFKTTDKLEKQEFNHDISNEKAQDDYWNNLEELLTEEKSANPIYPDSVGKDQDNPKPSWVKEDFLEEISNLKQKLYDIELELGKEDAGGGKWVEKCHHPKDESLLSKIEKLKNEIDTLSNKLGKEDEVSVSQWDFSTKRG